MAESGTFTTSNSFIVYKIVVTESSTSTSSNTSSVRVQVQATQTTSGSGIDYAGECKIKIDGVEYASNSWSKGQKVINYSSYTTLYDATHTIYHNYDGSKSILVSAYFELYEDYKLKLASNFNSSYLFALTILNRLASVINATGNFIADGSSPKITIYANVPNTANTHTITLKNGSTSVLSISGLTLADGYNEITPTAQMIGDIITYMSNNSLTSFVGTWVLTTYSGQTQIGSSSSCTSLVRTTAGSGNPLVSFRPGKVGINNSNPTEPLDVNGTIKCTELNQSTPSMQVTNGVLQFLRW